MSTVATITVQITVEVPDEYASSGNPPVSVRVSTAPPPMVHETNNAEGLPEAVDEMLSLRAPHAQAPLYRRFLHRCQSELGATLATPTSGDRPYLNINPPAGRRGGRLAALNLTSGRLHVQLDPARAGEWQHAQVVTNNGEPAYLRVYLDDESAADAFDMVRAVLANR